MQTVEYSPPPLRDLERIRPAKNLEGGFGTGMGCWSFPPQPIIPRDPSLPPVNAELIANAFTKQE